MRPAVLHVLCLILLSSTMLAQTVRSKGHSVTGPKSTGGISEVSGLSDSQFLRDLMKRTWVCLDAMIEETTGLPRDSQLPGGHTNTTNVGLYLASLCVAKETDLVSPSQGYRRAERILASLETFKRVKGFMPNTFPVDLSVKTSHGVMAVSDFNKLVAGLIMTRQTFPHLSDRITVFLDQIDWTQFYNSNTGRTYWGFNLDTSEPVGETNLMLTADTRLATFMLVATETAPPAIWEGLHRGASDTEAGRICAPGYGFGALFMHAMDGLFIPEHDTEVGQSAGNLAWHQIQFAKKHNYPLWGWSNCCIPRSGYSEGGFVPQDVVTPYAAALVIEYYPRHVIDNLRRMVQLGGYTCPEAFEFGRWGFSDSYDMTHKTWDHRYLSLDQGMLFLSLANYLYHDVVRKIYMRDSLVQHGLNLLKPHIKNDKQLLTLWRERDRIPIQPYKPLQKSTKPITQTYSVDLNTFSCNTTEKSLKIQKQKDSVLIHFNNNNNDAELICSFVFEPIDLSALDRLEIDLDVLPSSRLPVGELRLTVQDRFGQQRYAYVELDPDKNRYTIESRALYGIFLDEEAVQRVNLIFWKKPWYYSNQCMKTDTCELAIKAIRFLTCIQSESSDEKN